MNKKELAHTVTLSEIAGTYSRVIASDGKKFLSAVVFIDEHGGHRHAFLVEICDN